MKTRTAIGTILAGALLGLTGGVAANAAEPAPTPMVPRTLDATPSATRSPVPSPPRTLEATPASTRSAPAVRQPYPCEAYVYTGSKQNLCAAFPGERSDVDCKDVKYRVTLRNPEVDPWGLDLNKGDIPGVGCESNPIRHSPAPTATATRSPSKAAPVPTATRPVGAGLPVTGDQSAKAGFVVGAILVVVGGVAIAAGRRRRAKFEA